MAKKKVQQPQNDITEFLTRLPLTLLKRVSTRTCSLRR